MHRSRDTRDRDGDHHRGSDRGFTQRKRETKYNDKRFKRDDKDERSPSEESVKTHQTANSSAKLSVEFADYKIAETSMDLLKKRGIVSMFPIQAATYDLIYSGKDIIARDLTGSGKTLAFALPLIERLRNNKEFIKRKQDNEKGPLVLALAPTRELALQVLVKKNEYYRWRMSSST